MKDKYIVIDNSAGVVCECDTLEEAKQEKIEWDAEHKFADTDIFLKCPYCKEWRELEDKTCGCPESLDESNQLAFDNAAEAKSERKRGC